MGKISLSNIAEELAARNGLTRDAADNFMRAFIATIEKGLQEDSIVKVKGLGTFKLQEVSDRDSVDINTGERITIKGYRKVTFTPDTAMKELVNRPFAHFEPTELSDGYPTEDDSMVSESPTDDNEEVEITTDAATIETTIEEASHDTQEPAAEETTEEVISAAPEVNEPDEAIELVTTEEVEAVENPEPTESQAQETEEPQAEAKTTAPAEVPTEPTELPTTSAEASETTKQAPKKQRQYGWLIALLIVVATIGAYHWYTTQFVEFKQSPQDLEEEQSAITVNPNLEDELGSSWGNDTKVPATQPTPKKEDALPAEKQAASPTPADAKVAEPEEPQSPASAPVKEVAAPASKPTTTAPSTPGAKFCAVTLTESLSAKEIKDITPADTTDYAIASTLTTHKLRNGETIILLAKKYYGDKRLWPYIVKHNQLKDFNNVAIGQMIKIPVLQEKDTK